MSTAADKARSRVRRALESYGARKLGVPDPHVLRIELPIATPSLNEVNGWHWAKRHKWTQQIQLLVRTEARRRGWDGGGPPKRMRVKVIRSSAGELDHDNLVAGCKGLIDALVREGVLHDDSPKWCTISYEQRRAKRGEGRTLVEVSEA